MVLVGINGFFKDSGGFFRDSRGSTEADFIVPRETPLFRKFSGSSEADSMVLNEISRFFGF